jgi:hypothetical protein
MEIFMKTLVDKYDDEQTDFGTLANKAIAAHFKAMKTSTSKLDPDRLGSRSVFISKLRSKLIDKCPTLEISPAKTE